MKRHYLLAFFLTLILLLSCKKENNITEPSQHSSSIEEKFVGMYDGTFEVYYSDLNNGEISEGRKTPTVVEIRKDHQFENKWHYFVDGDWQLALSTANEYGGTLFFNVNPNSGRFSSSGESYTVEGYTDENQYHGSFNSITGRFHIGYIFKNITPSRGYDIIVLYKGYLR